MKKETRKENEGKKDRQTTKEINGIHNCMIKMKLNCFTSKFNGIQFVHVCSLQNRREKEGQQKKRTQNKNAVY